VNNKPVKKVILLVTLTLILLSYLACIVAVKMWVKKYNDGQWQQYLLSFNKVKNEAKPYNECLRQLKHKRDTYQASYEKGVRNGYDSLDKQEQFESNMYSFLRRLTESLNDKLEYYTREAPELQGGMFLTSKGFDKEVFLNPLDVKKYLPKTEEALSWYINHLEGYEMTEIKRLYCPVYEVEKTDFITYPLKKESCIELMKIRNGLIQPPSKDEDELQVEYEDEIARYESGKEASLKGCDEQGMLNEFTILYCY